MKQELVQLAKDKGFVTEISYNMPKDSLGWLFWMTELQKWLREVYEIDIQPIVNYKQLKQIKSYRTGIIYITQLPDRRLLQTFFIRPEGDKVLFIEFNTYEQALERGLFESLKLLKDIE